jgi:hypothetical protein
MGSLPQIIKSLAAGVAGDITQSFLDAQELIVFCNSIGT